LSEATRAWSGRDGSTLIRECAAAPNRSLLYVGPFSRSASRQQINLVVGRSPSPWRTAARRCSARASKIERPRIQPPPN